MRKYFGIAAAAYLGFAVKTFTEVGLENWQWWAVCIPTLLGFYFYTDYIQDLNTKK